MVEAILLGSAIFVIIVLLIINKKQYQKGSNDLLLMFLKSVYDLKTQMFNTLNKNHKDNGIVFIGDSITQDYNIYEFFPGLVVYNRGIGGDTSIGLLKRLKVSVDDLNPNKVVLLIGTNDFVLLKHKIESIRDNIKEIVVKIYQNNQNVEIYLISVLPVNHKLNPKTVGIRNNHDIEALNKQLETISNVNFINAYQTFVDDDNRLFKSLTYDGLHLNHLGYVKLSELLKPYLYN
ncbi:MAG: GDSL-type esterase/lipase family protein [Firmicutes bacterium]|nr:GDSL-type esterase/lipase family protein [Bacillota bacterium]